MKLLFGCACLLIAASVVIGPRGASADPTTMPSVSPTTMPTAAPVAINKFCPVTHEAVDPKIPTVQYKGMTIGFCCEDCVKDFSADPEKFMANLK